MVFRFLLSLVNLMLSITKVYFKIIGDCRSGGWLCQWTVFFVMPSAQALFRWRRCILKDWVAISHQLTIRAGLLTAIGSKSGVVLSLCHPCREPSAEVDPTWATLLSRIGYVQCPQKRQATPMRESVNNGQIIRRSGWWKFDTVSTLIQRLTFRVIETRGLFIPGRDVALMSCCWKTSKTVTKVMWSKGEQLKWHVFSQALQIFSSACFSCSFTIGSCCARSRSLTTARASLAYLYHVKG